MTSSDVRVPAEALRSHITELFARAGMEEEDARYMASALVQSSLWGKDSHGVLRCPNYVERLRNAAINPRPAIATVAGGGALEIIDGDNGPGFLVARAAMDRAIQLARHHGVGAVGARRSNHFGAASLYARAAAREGMIGIALTNSVAKLVAPGGTRPVTGSNPIAVAAPGPGDVPFAVDVSMAAVAGGKLLLAAQRGEKIAAGLATDKEGRPTEDPAEAFAGFWSPLAGIKGLGLSYAFDLLSGVLTGAAFGLGMKSQYAEATTPSGTGHFMIALRVDAVMDRAEFDERIERFCADIRSTPTRDAETEIMVPGQRSATAERERLRDGIPVPAMVYRQLVELGRELGVEVALPTLP